MVRGLFNKLISRSLSVAGKWQQQQLRRLNIHEYQLKKSERQFRMHFQTKVSWWSKVRSWLGVEAWEHSKVVLRVVSILLRLIKVEDIAGKMLGQILVTKQTGPQGKVVSKVYLCQKLSLINEMYFAITLDRKTAGPLIIACRKGGTSIEDLAEKFPDMIIKVPVDVFKGITDEDAAKVVDGLAPKVADRNASIEQVKKLYKLFCECDCTQLEINPIAETADNQLVAADAKLNFDDNAAFRQKEIFTYRDPTQEDPREVAAAKADLNYIGLDGEIGCMVNGAGLAMATMDIIKLHGGTPANFLDVGGNASEGQVVEAFKILTSDDKVKAILVNIFGGIMKCDIIASGIVNAAKQVQLKVPVIVRLEGTNVDQGKRILKPFKRYVEIGRVALVNYGKDYGKLVVIVDVIDQNRALVDSPDMVRTQMNFKRLSLTDITIDIKRVPKKKTLIAAMEAADVKNKWENSSWGRKLIVQKRRASLNDFDRFKLMLAKIKRAGLVKQELAKLKKQSTA
ncbi:ATP citrate lyase (ACL) family protein [Actinidia rufa]|uniref:Succinyl-CoA synthetase beta chain n=1 Tax=Actinidia rufa TaxID=165716 RepID=A0A7J0GRS5_9ERIC|nr:ATP citrate lyase (ACL) family protein [Actinidia rufa]